MKELWNKLSGKKTYIVAAVAALTFVGQLLGFIPDPLAAQIYTALGITGAVTIRHGMKK